MASPLDILGALGQIGGSGAAGVYQGEIEGKKLQKDFETRDLENQMRMLRNMQIQQTLGPQYSYDPQGRVILTAPNLPPRMVGELPQTQYGQARLDLMGEQARLNQQKADLAEGRLKLLEESGGRKKTDVETYRDLLSRGDRAGAEQFLKDIAAVKAAEAAPAKPAQQLEMPVRTQLKAMGVDPDAATPEQIKKATEEVDKRIAARTGVTAQIHADITGKAAQDKEARKTESQIGPMRVAITQMEGVLDKIDKEGFLPKEVPSGNWLAAAKEQARAKAHQLTFGSNSPAWQQWITNQGALIGIDRSVYNDLGRGGQMMYSAVKNFSEHPPTIQGARAAFKQWREAMAAREGATAPRGGPTQQTFPSLPDPASVPGQTFQNDTTGERFKSDGVKWDRVQGSQSQPAGRTTSQTATKRFNPATGKLEPVTQ